MFLLGYISSDEFGKWAIQQMSIQCRAFFTFFRSSDNKTYKYCYDFVNCCKCMNVSSENL